jgi:hypothetical protein
MRLQNKRSHTRVEMGAQILVISIGRLPVFASQCERSDGESSFFFKLQDQTEA